ncbi:hypothetical protein TPA0910_11410 [Streptomyces hygroscopicus subsp. sporocinereus]|uniref:Uncharacterized protein n=1 Tax=Streptomyces hygroscopicus TaxID=1912 RepID=A0ABQ3TUS6_STRHY|nr:hypothetical protein TPA0910_11410 [Streptomyces hygroscopicus]
MTTVTGTGPGACAGGTVTVTLSSRRVEGVTDTLPNRTSVVVISPRPVTVSVSPPLSGPEVRLMPVITESWR